MHSSNNQPTTTTDAASMSTMTTVTHPVGLHIVDEFEPDPKREITTLEKASYDCSDIMEKVIDNIVELGGCQQFPDLDHQDGSTNREEAVEHIQREIIGDRNHTHHEQKNQHEQQCQDVNQPQQIQEPEPQTQTKEEIQLQSESQHTETSTTATTTTTEDLKHNEQVYQAEDLAPVQEVSEGSPALAEQQTDLNTSQNIVLITEESASHEQKDEGLPMQKESEPVKVLEEEALGDIDNVAVQEVQDQTEVVDGEDQERSVVEEIVAAGNIVEESIQEEEEKVEKSIQKREGEVEENIQEKEQVEEKKDEGEAEAEVEERTQAKEEVQEKVQKKEEEAVEENLENSLEKPDEQTAKAPVRRLRRGLLNPKLKLPPRTKVRISESPPAPKPATKPTPRPATKPAPKSATKPVAKPTTRPVPKPTTRPEPKPTTRPEPKSVPRPSAGMKRPCEFNDFGFRKYRCDLCRFSTDRLNTIVAHQKNAVCEAAKLRYESHVQESLHKLQSPKANKKRYSKKLS